ncbi:MAG: cytochrome c nitrite reductase small subunit [Bryobacterales bacterium]|nr:cytochrome c nitrite reductase small subunit [Bryobacterales bacterium]
MSVTRSAPWLVGLLVGLALGLGLFTFGYARGASYMTDDPAACRNCHVMNEQYDGWLKSSHRKAAVCNDCHAPAGFLPKYFTKALNGFNHSLAFTTNRFPDHIQINGRNAEVAEAACAKCHQEVVESVHGARPASSRHASGRCVSCHRNVGHVH